MFIFIQEITQYHQLGLLLGYIKSLVSVYKEIDLNNANSSTNDVLLK